MQNRVLSKRENKLLIILIIIIFIGLYYLFVFREVKTSLDNLAIQKETLENDIIYNETAIQMMEAMKIELEKIYELPQTQITEIPLFDNEEALLQKLKIILSETLDYTFAFSPYEVEDTIVRKNLNISFKINGFDNMQELVDKIYNTGYRVLINELQYSVVNHELEIEDEKKKDSKEEEVELEEQEIEQIYSVVLGITFFERTE